MTEEVLPVKKKKKKDSFDIFHKEFKRDPNDLRIMMWLGAALKLNPMSIDMKKHEILNFLIKDYTNRKSPVKKKQILDYVKNLSKNPESLPTGSDTTDLWIKDIIRAFGDPKDSSSIAAKIIDDIYNFPEQVYNCNYDPNMLVTKLYEIFAPGKTKTRQIYWRPYGKPSGKVGAAGSSNYWLAGLSSELTSRRFNHRM